MKYKRILEIAGTFVIGILGGKNADASSFGNREKLGAKEAVQVTVDMPTPKEEIVSIMDISEIRRDTTKLSGIRELKRIWQQALSNMGMSTDDVLTVQDMQDLLAINEKDHSLRSICAGIDNYKFSSEDLILMKPDEQSRKIAEKSKEYCVGTIGKCYHAVKGTIMSASPIAFLDGKFAYNAKDYLSQSPNHVEIPISFSDTDKIAEGATVVFGKGNTAAGHTYTSYRSKETKSYVTENGDVLEYYKSRERSDHEQNANLSGKRGSSGQKYGKPSAYFTSGTEVGIQTFLKIALQYAKDKLHCESPKPRDVLQAVEALKEESSKQLQAKAEQAADKFTNFKQATVNDQGYWMPKKIYVQKTVNVRTKPGNSRT